MFRNNIYFLAFVGALSGLLYGYDAGVISGAMLFIKHTFSVTDTGVGLIVSAVPIGAVISAACSGRISDMFGRKKTLLATAAFFCIGSLVCAFAPDVATLIVGRLLLGIAVGIGSSTSPVYIAEVAPEQYRGGLVTFFLVACQAGILCSYIVNYIFAHQHAWRYMLGLGVVPALILGICALVLPESPRWLVVKDKIKQARTILENIHGKLKARTEIAEIKKVVKQEKMSLATILRTHYARVIFLGIIVSIFTQTVGINAIIYYAPTIFQSTGFNTPAVSILATIGIGVVLTLSAIVAVLLLDRIGRRKLLLFGLAGIIMSLVLIIYAFAAVKNPLALAWLMLIGSMLFVAFQGISVGQTCFLIPSEIFPVKIRGTGMGISIAFNWLANSLVAMLFPIGLVHIGTAGSFSVFLFLSVIGWILFYYYVPETKNVTLEQIEMNILAGVKLRDLGKKTTVTKQSISTVTEAAQTQAG